jgi:hypothetical protein
MLLAGDLACLTMATLLAAPVRTMCVLPLAYAAMGLYSAIPKHPAEELRRIFAVTVLAFALTATGWADVLAVSLTLLLVPAFRRVLRAHFATRGWWAVNVAVLASDSGEAEDMLDLLLSRPEQGFKPVAVLHGGSVGRTRGSDISIRGPLEFAAYSRAITTCAVRSSLPPAQRAKASPPSAARPLRSSASSSSALTELRPRCTPLQPMSGAYRASLSPKAS